MMNHKFFPRLCLLTAILITAAAAGCIKTVTTTETSQKPITTSATQGGQTQTPLTTSNTTQGSATTSQAGVTTSTKPVTTASTTKPATTAKTTTSTSAGGFPDIVSIKELASYRYSIMTRVEEGPGAGETDFMKYEWVKAQKAEHAWLEDADGNVTEVYIIIGDKQWAYMSMFGWILQTRPATTTAANDELQKIMKDPNAYKAKFTKVGSEEVNGFKCLHYEFEYTIKTTIPAVTGTTTIDAHSVGEMWIADQAGMPKVVILSKSTSDMTVRNEKTVVYNEQSLTDIGEPISIEPPDDVFTPPTGMPSIPMP
jgi:hypothetical protein